MDQNGSRRIGDIAIKLQDLPLEDKMADFCNKELKKVVVNYLERFAVQKPSFQSSFVLHFHKLLRMGTSK